MKELLEKIENQEYDWYTNTCVTEIRIGGFQPIRTGLEVTSSELDRRGLRGVIYNLDNPSTQPTIAVWVWWQDGKKTFYSLKEVVSELTFV